MPILNQFAGMIPKLDGRSLPNEAAQSAKNVNIVNGKLAPINVPGPFQVFHDPDTGKMKSGIADGNIIYVDQPSTPSISERIRLLRPDDWSGTTFTLGLWVTYFDSSGVFQTDSYAPTIISGSGEWEYTNDGVIWRARLNGRSFTAQPGIYYTVHGINWGVAFQADNKYFGGPEQAYSFPAAGYVDRTSPEFPQFSMPLTAPIDYTDYDNNGDKVYTGERYTYGHLQLVSVNAPVTEPVVDATALTSSTTVELTEPGYVEFHFKANYVRNRQTFVNYIRTLVDQRVSEGVSEDAYSGAVSRIDMKDIVYGDANIPSAGKVRLTNGSGLSDDVDYSSYGVVDDVYQFTVSATLTYSYGIGDTIEIIDTTAAGKEGPPSDLSELSSVDPGELVNLDIALPDGYYRQNIYRSSSDADFRLLVDELTDDSYIDTFIENLTVDLPPYGNYPHSTLALAKEGSVVIGGHTAIIFDEYDVRPSEPYKQWVYPEEYAIVLDSPFLAAASFGSSAVVFTDTHPITSEVGKVYLISGQNPRYLNRVEISSDKPLLNKRSLCVIDNTAFYATTDGLCAVSPGGIRIMTEPFFTREQWLDYRPSLMSAYTADNSIFVIGLSETGAVHFRFDLGEGGGISTFTTYDAFSDADFTWKSKIFESPKPISYRNVQISADGYPVEITLIGDAGVAKHTILISDERARMLPRMKRSRDWEFQLRGRSTVSRVAITNSVQELNS